MTDAPTCGDFTSVVVTIDGIEVTGNDGTPYKLTLQSPIQQNLLALAGDKTLPLGPIPLPAGTYNQFRLLLAPTTNGGGTPANYVTTQSGGSAQYPLTTPSAQQSGYKINGQFTVNPGNTVDVVVDFNACRSVVTAGKSGKYILKPVLQAIDQSTSGLITGTLGTNGAGSMAYAEDANGIIYKSTIADSNGNFTLAFLPATASSTAGYNVVVAPPQPSGTAPVPTPNFAPDVVLNVPVTAGQGTIVSSSPLPMNLSTDAAYSGSIALEPNAPAGTGVLVLAQQPVTNDSATNTVTFAETTGVQPASGSTAPYSYSMTFPNAAPTVGTYKSGSTPSFPVAPSTAPPNITVEAFGEDGATGTAASSTSPNITMSGSGNTTYQSDN